MPTAVPGRPPAESIDVFRMTLQRKPGRARKGPRRKTRTPHFARYRRQKDALNYPRYADSDQSAPKMYSR